MNVKTSGGSITITGGNSAEKQSLFTNQKTLLLQITTGLKCLPEF
ncbi:MAG: hypothetical protein ACRYFB_06890 [Janthinobacterium lividum]